MECMEYVITNIVTIQYSTVGNELIQNKTTHAYCIQRKPISTIVGIKEVMASLPGIELSLSLNTNSSASTSINGGSPLAAILKKLQIKLKF